MFGMLPETTGSKEHVDLSIFADFVIQSQAVCPFAGIHILFLILNFRLILRIRYDWLKPCCGIQEVMNTDGKKGKTSGEIDLAETSKKINFSMS